MRSTITALLWILMTFQTTGAQALENSGATDWFDNWFGSNAPSMSENEFDSIICIASAASVGVLITLVGGTAIVIGGNVGAAAGTAIALPVLVSSMWAACALGRTVTPGALWLHRRSEVLVKQLGGAINNTLPSGSVK